MMRRGRRGASLTWRGGELCGVRGHGQRGRYSRDTLPVVVGAPSLGRFLGSVVTPEVDPAPQVLRLRLPLAPRLVPGDAPIPRGVPWGEALIHGVDGASDVAQV